MGNAKMRKDLRDALNQVVKQIEAGYKVEDIGNRANQVVLNSVVQVEINNRFEGLSSTVKLSLANVISNFMSMVKRLVEAVKDYCYLAAYDIKDAAPTVSRAEALTRMQDNLSIKIIVQNLMNKVDGGTQRYFLSKSHPAKMAMAY